MKKMILISLLIFFITDSRGQNKIDSIKNSIDFISEIILRFKTLEFDSLSYSYNWEGKGILSECLIYDSIPRYYKIDRIDTCFDNNETLILIHIKDLSEKWYFTIISNFFEDNNICNNQIEKGNIYYLTLHKTDDDPVNRSEIGGLPKLVTIKEKVYFFYSNTLLYRAVTTDDIKGLCLTREN